MPSVTRPSRVGLTGCRSYDETLHRSEDKELWLRTAAFSRFHKMEDRLLYYRIANRSSAKQGTDAIHDRRILRKYGPALIGVRGTARLVVRSWIKQQVFRAAASGMSSTRLLSSKMTNTSQVDKSAAARALRAALSAHVPGWESIQDMRRFDLVTSRVKQAGEAPPIARMVGFSALPIISAAAPFCSASTPSSSCEPGRMGWPRSESIGMMAAIAVMLGWQLFDRRRWRTPARERSKGGLAKPRVAPTCRLCRDSDQRSRKRTSDSRRGAHPRCLYDCCHSDQRPQSSMVVHCYRQAERHSDLGHSTAGVSHIGLRATRNTRCIAADLCCGPRSCVHHCSGTFLVPSAPRVCC